jgi:tellurite resistance protein TerC
VIASSQTDFADVVVPSWGWPALIGVIATLLLVDILVIHRRAHVIKLKEAVVESVAWISCGVAFMFVVWWMFRGQADGRQAGVEYISGYLIEKSLSIDNVFVWAMIFTHFKVPRQFQHRVLFWGIFGALVLRFIFIILGVAVIERFDYVLIGFGAFLIYTGFGVLRHGGEDDTNPSDTRTMRLFHRFVPTTDDLDGQKLFTRVNGKRMATPLLAVLVVVEISDLIFAVDSVPAVLAVSHEQFIVFGSNAFAIMGLRALYFLFADIKDRFRYLKPAISVLLMFVGAKMLVSHWYHVPTMLSLGIILLVMTVAIVASVIHDRKHYSPQGGNI